MKFEVREIAANNVGMFATRPLKQGEEIFREAPFFSIEPREMMSPRVSDAADAQELKRCQDLLEVYANMHLGKEGFQNEFPAEARAVLDRIVEIKAVDAFGRLPEAERVKWMALHDAHQISTTHHSPRESCVVVVVGLESERGRALNGRVGKISGQNAYDRAADRWRVTFAKCEAAGEAQEFDMAIRARNLKTAGGIYRTNAWPEGLFEWRSRMNHSCDPNTAARESEGGAVAIVACRDVEVDAELTCNYIIDHPNLSATERQDLLKSKYGFDCQCRFCEAGARV